MIPKPVTLPASLFLIMAMGLSGCSNSDDAQGPDSAAANSPAQIAANKIQWFKGSTAEAFAKARKQEKPLFLFWGTDWFPDCSQVKATIFSGREFIAKSRLFVPVYLDGDTENAQRTGEEFGVKGYPTMIVFSPQGDEITRIPGGISSKRYNNVLDLALNDVQPVARIIERVTGLGPALKKNEYRLLAYYSWDQDNERALAGKNKLKLFETLSSTCPSPLIETCSRIDIEYLSTIAKAIADDDDPFALSESLKNEALKKLRSLLQDRKLVLANLQFVLSSSAEMARAFTDSRSPHRASLLGLWDQALKIIAADPQVSLMDRLYTSRGRLRMARIDDPEQPLSPEFQQRIADHIDWADQQAITSDERQAVIDAAWNILSEAGMDEKATELITRELGKSNAPYYFMPFLAKLAERSGNTGEAVDWLRRAYDESSGSATRFQWGYKYISGLLRLVPADIGLIEKETIRVFDELDGRENAFYQRTRQRLGKLDAKFREWNADGANDKSIRLIYTKMQTICSSIPEIDESRTTCDSFLSEG